jgi:hypothetical protein
MPAVTVLRKKPSIHSAIGPRRKRDGHVSEREEGLIKTHAVPGTESVINNDRGITRADQRQSMVKRFGPLGVCLRAYLLA